MENILAYDLGTGGIKASVFNRLGQSVADTFVKYETYHPSSYQEQKPSDWWNATVLATQKLLQQGNFSKDSIKGIGISGHSLGVVAVDNHGELLAEKTPIWSDDRAKAEANDFFCRVSPKEWYQRTGNGFPAHLYSIFKIMWYKRHARELYDKAYKFMGTKDYINFILTGTLCTDHSYASGSGVYDLQKEEYSKDYLESAEICPDKLPEIVSSTELIGELTPKAAQALGLAVGTKVVSGGVDNSCMALGANCYTQGEAYISLGSSAWVAVSSATPILDFSTKPYVFKHCVKDMSVSATAIFSAGTSHEWAMNHLFSETQRDISPAHYKKFDQLAAQSPPGANKLLFNPSLSGGSSIDPSVNIRGSFNALSVGHTSKDLMRAVLEGVAFHMKIAFEELSKIVSISDKILLVGGGGKSALWRQIFADVLNKEILETTIGQDAASLGAAALVAVALGFWEDFSRISKVHQMVDVKKPIQSNTEIYSSLFPIFKEICKFDSRLGDTMQSLTF